MITHPHDPFDADCGRDRTLLPMPHVDGVSHHYVTAGDGSQLHVAEAGAGPPVVLLHGWPQHWFAWRFVIGPLAERFRVLCPDVRGLGWSRASGSDWSLRRLAADVIDVLDAMGVERAGIVGHDWGAAIAYRLGLDYPQRIERLMPLAAVHPWAASGLHPRTLWRPWHVYASAVVAPVGNTWLQIPQISLRTWRRVGSFTPAEIEIYCSSMRQPTAVHATTRYYRNLLTHEVPYFWRHAKDVSLAVAVRHLNGADDPLTQRLSNAFRDHAPHMTLANLPNCGHFIAEECPAELVSQMNGFFGVSP